MSQQLLTYLVAQLFLSKSICQQVLVRTYLQILRNQGHKIRRDFFVKPFHGRWGTNVFGQIYWGAVLRRGLMIRSCQGQGSFANALFSNLKTVNLKILAIH